MQQPIRIDAVLDRALKQHEAGQLRQAEKGYKSTLKKHPNHPVALLFLGVMHHDQGRHEEAVRLIKKSIKFNPIEPAAYNHLGLVFMAQQNTEEAVASFRKSVEIKPGYLDGMNNLGNALKNLKRYDEAAHIFKQVIQINPFFVYSQHNLGLLEFTRGNFELAEKLFKKALELDPNFYKAHHQLGLTAENMGDFEKAAAYFETTQRLVPEHFPSMASLLSLRDHPLDETMIDRAEKMATRKDLPSPENYTVCYSLAKRFDRAKEYDKAFHYLKLANDRRSTSQKYQAPRVEKQFKIYADFFSEEFMEQHQGHGSSSERPVFVLGMPRTGTTLTEQILAAHGDIFGAGELPDLPKIVNRLPQVMRDTFQQDIPPYPHCLPHLNGDFITAMVERYDFALNEKDVNLARVVDKNPFNFLNVGLIHLLYPNARIIHCKRNPLDVAVSCYMEMFDLTQDFTTDFMNFGHYYTQYSGLMDHWKKIGIPIFDTQYEDLVEDMEKASRAIIDFCGLPWDESCLSYQNKGRAVLTPSKWQVRQPIYKSSRERWRNYEAHLQPLKAFFEQRGYL